MSTNNENPRAGIAPHPHIRTRPFGSGRHPHIRISANPHILSGTLFVQYSLKNIMSRLAIKDRAVTATEEQEAGKNMFRVAPGVWRLKDVFVNCYIIQNTEGTNWVLVDTGLKTTAAKIRKLTEEVFGSAGSRPSAIVLTHGHFDHVGSVATLAEEWGVPVYCHKLEMPYLTGRSKYPPADPSVGGGLMSMLSWTFPRGPINIEEHVMELPADHSVPGLSEWKWIHTPGHAPGHVSLYREQDGVLIAGDAFVTTNQQSAIAVMTQKKELHGPPMYFTIDWGAAARSVKALAALQPQVVATGHGQTLYGASVRKSVNKLTREFWDLAMPEDGRYLHEPALTNEDGVTYLPPARTNYSFMAAAGVSAFVIALTVYLLNKRKKSWS
jgi:glyoxylase-like metal-dependent hydrolase (beta-lactamase superfamily II)